MCVFLEVIGISCLLLCIEQLLEQSLARSSMPLSGLVTMKAGNQMKKIAPEMAVGSGASTQFLNTAQKEDRVSFYLPIACWSAYCMLRASYIIILA